MMDPTTRDPQPGAVACTTEQETLGEGARWDAERSEFLHVDIVRGLVWRHRVRSDGSLSLVRSYGIGEPVGAIAPIRGDDGWLLAAGRGFRHLAPDGTVSMITDVAPLGARMNDAVCDAAGRCWAGSLADDHAAGGGALHRLHPDGTTDIVLDGLTIPNGIGWSPDGTTMYLIDSIPGVIHAFEHDPVTGSIGAGHELVRLKDGSGAPDGLTVDRAGRLWVAVYGGGCVHCYAPDGRLEQVLQIPAEQTTSCAFAGPELDTMYVTTATENWSDERRRGEPAAGLVYRVDPGASGHPATPFVPDPTWWAERHFPIVRTGA
jgi:sugar lactone lactonase YvrE